MSQISLTSTLLPTLLPTVVLLGITAVSNVACATAPHDGLFSGDKLQPISVETIAGQVKAGEVLIVSEQHGNAIHYARQKEVLQKLAETKACTVSVGLEFLAWPHQAAIDSFFDGKMAEADFLKAAEWGSNPFADYKDQALFPRKAGGRLIGINAPRALSGAVSKRGIAGLTPAEAALLPPNFTVGNALYRERFDVVMSGHVPKAALDRYFEAQSLWDDSMAHTAAEFLKANPTHCLVIIVGDFHAAWGGGLPDRLKANGLSGVHVVSQVESNGLSNQEINEELGPHPAYGNRADGIWISATP